MDDLSWKGFLRALVCLTVPIVSGIGLPTARGQANVTPTPVAAATDGVSGAVPTPPVIDPREIIENDEQPPPSSVVPGPPGYGTDGIPARIGMGPIEVIRESIFGEASADDWQPLSLFDFFSTGWDEPWVKSPPGTNGAPKQNWFGAADGVFVRLSSLNFFYTNGMTGNTGLLLTPLSWAPVKPKTDGNQYWASYNLYLPLNQRLELLVVAPFIASNKTGPTGHYVGNFGDLTFSTRFRMIEQRNFSFQALLTERIPTGKTVNGNDINFVTPSFEFWWNFAPKWVVRGGTGINIDTGRTSATSPYFNNLAIGRYLTSKDTPIVRDLVAHVAVSTLSDVLGRKNGITEVYVAPGLRFGLDPEQKWYALGAVQIPVAGPQPYVYQLDLALVRTF